MSYVALHYTGEFVQGPNGTTRPTVRCEVPPNTFAKTVFNDIRRDDKVGICLIIVNPHDPCLLELVLDAEVVDGETVVMEFIRRGNGRFRSLSDDDKMKFYLSEEQLNKLLEEQGRPNPAFAINSAGSMDRNDRE